MAKLNSVKNEDAPIVFLRKACMDIILNEIEVRVLGSLMEKALSTPDYYGQEAWGRAKITFCNDMRYSKNTP